VIPMAALVAVMIFVCWATFDWHSIYPRTLKMMPKSETLVMITTVIVVVATHYLAIGVGVLVAMVMFACRVAHFVTVERTVRTVDGHETATYVLDAITEKYRRHGRDVKVIGLNDASTLMRERLCGKLGAGH
jgi:SulP family sulfate permease